ncbi:MAG: glucose-6-phosphate dehydrogenase [Jatrophihabitans sp.]
MIETLVIFGAGGDLTGRFLLPAVAALLGAGELSPDFRLVGSGDQDWDAADFAEHVRDRLSAHAQHVEPAARDSLIAALRYRRADVSVAAEMAAVLDLACAEAGSGPVVVYLALPTQLMLAAVRGVNVRGLPAGSRIAIEKPFGFDAASAADLNSALAGIDSSPEQAGVYRVDHILAMTAVQQLPRACFPGTNNPIEWNTGHIEQIDLLYEETLALEGRASFYDRAGALRDVMQNHLLQILCAVAQPHPCADAQTAPAELRASTLRTVRHLSSADVVTCTRRARYTAGRLSSNGGTDGRRVPDYTAEHGVEPARNTETFAEVALELDSAQWAQTRFVLRAGKALDAHRRGVLIHLRSRHDAAAAASAPVWLDIDELIDAGAVSAEALAYERIVRDLLRGGTTYAVRDDEVELAWQVFTPVLHAWQTDAVPLGSYPAGSPGP